VGNIKTTADDVARARFAKYKRRRRTWKFDKPKKGIRSTRTVSGGLPSLGKRR
jgi:hypothetical protein